MKYAVVEIKGKQYKVEEDSEILVHRMAEKEKLEARILLTVDGEKVNIGTPEVKGAKVELKKLENEKGTKIQVFKYKSKSKYRRTIGSRPEFTRVSVGKIS